MGALEFDKCCCCCNLRSGCLVLGWFGVVFGILGASLEIAKMAGYQPVDENNELIWQAPIEYAVVDFIFAMITVFIYVMFLVGIYKSRPIYLKVVYIYLSVQSVVYFIVYCSNPMNQNVLEICSIIIATSIMAYLILCVRSYYLLMVDEQSVKQGTV